jgi:hypothetical protein
MPPCLLFASAASFAFYVSVCPDGFEVTNRDSVDLEGSGVLQCQAKL